MIPPIGYFRIWRDLYTKPIWLKSTLEQQVILMTLLAMANFQPKEWEWKGEKFKVQSGQFITSLENIRINTGGNVSIQNVRTALRRFEKLEFLTNQSTKTGRLITIVNWGDYQHIEGTPNIALNKDLTKTQQRPNKDLTPREEGNKDKEGNKDIYTSFFEEVWKLYPSKKGKSSVTKKTKKEIYSVGYEDIVQAINNYKKELEINTWQKPMNGSTFFNGRYEDYLKENYVVEEGNNGNTRTNDNKDTEDPWGIEKFITRG